MIRMENQLWVGTRINRSLVMIVDKEYKLLLDSDRLLLTFLRLSCGKSVGFKKHLYGRIIASFFQNPPATEH